MLASGDLLDNVEFVDLEKYQGIWYEQARVDSIQQQGATCVKTLIQRAFKQDVRLSFVAEYLKDYREQRLNGFLTAADNTGTKHFLALNIKPIPTDYFIVGLDPNYQWAVISNRFKSKLFINSRTSTFDAELLKLIVAEAAAKGYPADKLIYTDRSKC